MKESVYFDQLDVYIIDDIMYCIVNSEEMDIDFVKYSVDRRIAYSENNAYPCLFDVTKVKHSTKEARDYLANNGNELVLASALIVNSPMLKMAADFYVEVNKPVNPTKTFTDKNLALEWLNQFKYQKTK